MTYGEAELFTRMEWEPSRQEMVSYLINERKFTRKAAEKAINAFIETKAFVALKTGAPQFGKVRR